MLIMSKKKIEKSNQKKLNVPEVIDYCKNTMGLTFNLMDEERAALFLQKNNYFFRLKQYAEICDTRTKNGKYTGLDFGHLVELSTIDMFFRKIIFKLTIDFEHYLKVKLVNDCQNNPKDDGFNVVQDFLENNPQTKTSMQTTARLASYNGISFEKYVENPAVWNFVEMINFFDFINFYSFYYAHFKIDCSYTKHFDSVRRLRNASAHNVCMLSSFRPVQNFRWDVDINFELLQGNIGISPGIITTSMKVPVLNDFAVLLSLYTKIVSSTKVKQKSLEELTDFFDGRMILHKDYFEGMSTIKNAYQFARKVLEWYKGK